MRPYARWAGEFSRTPVRAGDLQHNATTGTSSPAGEGVAGQGVGRAWAYRAANSSQGGLLGEAVASSAPSARRARPHINLRAGGRRGQVRLASR